VQIQVLRNITQCRLVDSYRRFGVACCLYLHGPRNPRLHGRWCQKLKENCQVAYVQKRTVHVRNYLPFDTATSSKRLQYPSPSLLETRINNRLWVVALHKLGAGLCPTPIVFEYQNESYQCTVYQT
jgi:hypothetical protein